MRIKLANGKQKELIRLAKKGLTWEELADKLNANPDYLSHDLCNEKTTLPEIVYGHLCKITKKSFDSYILEKLPDNWGRSKGGLNSMGSTIRLPQIKFDEKLAEFVGAVLGDGHVCSYKKGKKVGVYGIRIAGDMNKDREYHINYLKKLCGVILGIEAREILRPKMNERFLDMASKELVKFFGDMGIKAGNKIKNQSTIPKWIWKEYSFLRACLRGLIDTDGSIFRMSKQDPNLLRINFVNHNITLLNDAREAFIKLGFNPSKIVNNRVFYLSRKDNIDKYLKEIGFSNSKHIQTASKV